MTSIRYHHYNPKRRRAFVLFHFEDTNDSASWNFIIKVLNFLKYFNKFINKTTLQFSHFKLLLRRRKTKGSYFNLLFSSMRKH